MMPRADHRRPNIDVVLVAEKIDQTQIIDQGRQTRKRGRPGVIDETESFGRRKVHLQSVLQRIEKVGAVAYAVKTMTTGIDNHPLPRIAELDALLAVGEQDCFLDHTRLGARTQKNRHVPISLLVGAVLK